MPKHYAQGVNIQQGRIEFRNMRYARVYYNLTFDKRPLVTISPEETKNIPKYRLWVMRDYFYIVFENRYTGVIVWRATL